MIDSKSGEVASLRDRAATLRRTAAILSTVGGVFVLAATYLITWFSLTSFNLNAHSYGGFSLYQLRTFVNGGWYWHAYQVMTVGAALLVSAGIAGLATTKKRSWNVGCAVAMVAGSGLVLYAALVTGLPHWFTHEPLNYSRGTGEWVCLGGTILGVIAVVLEVIPSSRVDQPGVEGVSYAPFVRTG